MREQGFAQSLFLVALAFWAMVLLVQNVALPLRFCFALLAHIVTCLNAGLVTQFELTFFN